MNWGKRPHQIHCPTSMYTLWFIFSKHYLPTEFYITRSAMHIGICVSECVCLSHVILLNIKMIQANANSTFHKDSFYLNWLLYTFSVGKIVYQYGRDHPYFISNIITNIKWCYFFPEWTHSGPGIFCFSFVVVKVRYISGLLLSLSFVVVFFLCHGCQTDNRRNKRQWQ